MIAWSIEGKPQRVNKSTDITETLIMYEWFDMEKVQNDYEIYGDDIYRRLREADLYSSEVEDEFERFVRLIVK